MEALANLGIDLWGVLLYITGFGVLLAVMAKFVYGPLLSKVDERREIIARNVSEAEELRKRFQEEIEEERQKQDAYMAEVRAKMAEAQAFAKQSAKELIADADERRERIITDAKRQAEEIRNEVISEAEAEIKRRMIEVVSKVIESAVPADIVKKSVEDQLNQLK
jgi:F-type H+-transporting ATPase subunit b